MDPDTNLNTQLTVARNILENEANQTGEAIQLAELVVALDEWIRKGGFLPFEWTNESRIEPPDAADEAENFRERKWRP